MNLCRSNKERLISLKAMAILLLLSHALPAKPLAEKKDKHSSDKDKHSPNKDKQSSTPDQATQSPIPDKSNLLPPGSIKLPGATIFDVTEHGAKGNGQPNLDEDSGDDLNAIAFVQTWHQACESAGPAIVSIPAGKYVVAQVLFTGPCKSPQIMVQNEGTLLANTDLSLYPSAEWILFEHVNNVIFTGSGQVNAQGSTNWNNNDCKKNTNCAPLPTSIKLRGANNSIIDGITSIDSMFFHVFLSGCQNVTVRGVKLIAPDSSPNTDGIHTSRSRHVTIYDSEIGTGDDCISIGQGSFDVSVSNLVCGPGHGLSVGSLGKEDEEQDVQGISFRNCTLKNTDNGARIKTWPGKVDTVASQILYEDVVMDSVKNPIVIDTTYSNDHHSTSKEPSHVKLSNIQFKNIRGTSANENIVTLICSAAVPCDQVSLTDIQLTPPPDKKAVTSCMNAHVTAVSVSEDINCQ